MNNNDLLPVKGFDGYGLFKQQNEAGGTTYLTDESGGYECILSRVWDTALFSKETLIAIAQDAYGLKLIDNGQ